MRHVKYRNPDFVKVRGLITSKVEANILLALEIIKYSAPSIHQYMPVLVNELSYKKKRHFFRNTHRLTRLIYAIAYELDVGYFIVKDNILDHLVNSCFTGFSNSNGGTKPRAAYLIQALVGLKGEMGPKRTLKYINYHALLRTLLRNGKITGDKHDRLSKYLKSK